jgi:hypothetical protein
MKLEVRKQIVGVFVNMPLRKMFGPRGEEMI